MSISLDVISKTISGAYSWLFRGRRTQQSLGRPGEQAFA